MVRRQPGQGGAEERPPFEVERRSAGGDEGLPLAASDLLRQPGKVGQRQPEPGRRSHDLHHLAVVLEEGGPQRFVAAHDFGQRPLQGGDIERSAQLRLRRHVVGGSARLQAVEQPEALLGERERRRPRGFAAGDGGRCARGPAGDPALGQLRGERPQGRRGEQDAQRQLDAEGRFQPGEDAGGEERVPAQVPEVVFEPDPVDLQHLRPDLRHPCLQLGARRDVPFFPVAAPAVRHRQGAAVDLAGRSERQRLEDHEVAGDHVVGKPPFEVTAKGRRGGSRAGGDQVGHQPPQPVDLGRRDHGLADFGMVGQDRLDLPQLDTEAAHFHLQVDPAEELDLAVRQGAREVAGAIEAPPRLPEPGREGVREEALGRQAGAAEVAARRLDAGEVELAGDSDRHRLQTGIEQVGAAAADGPADRRQRRPAPGVRGQAVDGDDVGLRRAVVVLQDAALHPAEPADERRRGLELLARRDHRPQVGEVRPPPLGRLGQVVEGDVGEEEASDPLPLQDAQEGVRIAPLRIGEEDQGPTGCPGREDLLHRDVEAQGGELERALLGPRGALEVEGDEIGEEAVVQRRPLGPAGRARGVDEVGEVLHPEAGGRWICRTFAGPEIEVLHQYDGAREAREELGQL